MDKEKNGYGPRTEYYTLTEQNLFDVAQRIMIGLKGELLTVSTELDYGRYNKIQTLWNKYLDNVTCTRNGNGSLIRLTLKDSRFVIAAQPSDQIIFLPKPETDTENIIFNRKNFFGAKRFTTQLIVNAGFKVKP